MPGGQPVNTLRAGGPLPWPELEALASVTDSWDLIGNYTYTDTEVLGIGGEQGHRLASVPEHMASLWSQHPACSASPASPPRGVRYVGASTGWHG